MRLNSLVISPPAEGYLGMEKIVADALPKRLSSCGCWLLFIVSETVATFGDVSATRRAYVSGVLLALIVSISVVVNSPLGIFAPDESIANSLSLAAVRAM